MSMLNANQTRILKVGNKKIIEEMELLAKSSNSEVLAREAFGYCLSTLVETSKSKGWEYTTYFLEKAFESLHELDANKAEFSNRRNV